MRWASALTIAPFALAALGSLSCSGTSDGVVDVGGATDAGNGNADAQTQVDTGMGPDAQVDVDAGPGMDAAGNPDAMADPDAGPADTGPADTGNQNCTYPAGSTGSFAVGEILTPFSWATSLDGMSVDRPLDLTQAFCNNDPNIDWSPFDMLLFVSIPAW